MSQWPLIGAALFGLAGLAFYCVPHDAHLIEQDVTARTAAALASAHVYVPENGLAVDGRAVTLRGPKGSAVVSDATRDLVASVKGVRDPVRVLLTEPVASAPEIVSSAPPAAALPVEAKKLEVDLTQFLEGKTIRFDVVSDVIHPEGQAVLNEVFRILASAPAVAVDITGHTDNEGDPNFNINLSRRRALAVKQYLVSRGIKPERLRTEGFGSSKPVVPNDTPEHMARNRRIEFHANAGIPGASLGNK